MKPRKPKSEGNKSSGQEKDSITPIMAASIGRSVALLSCHAHLCPRVCFEGPDIKWVKWVSGLKLETQLT